MTRSECPAALRRGHVCMYDVDSNVPTRLPCRPSNHPPPLALSPGDGRVPGGGGGGPTVWQTYHDPGLPLPGRHCSCSPYPRQPWTMTAILGAKRNNQGGDAHSGGGKGLSHAGPDSRKRQPVARKKANQADATRPPVGLAFARVIRETSRQSSRVVIIGLGSPPPLLVP